MKHGKFEIRKPNNQTGSGAYSLYEDGVPITSLSFGTEEAAFKYFKKYMGITETKKFHVEPEMKVENKERTVGNYSNSGYINLMGEYE